MLRKSTTCSMCTHTHASTPDGPEVVVTHVDVNMTVFVLVVSRPTSPVYRGNALDLHSGGGRAVQPAAGSRLKLPCSKRERNGTSGSLARSAKRVMSSTEIAEIGGSEGRRAETREPGCKIPYFILAFVYA